MAFSLDLKLEAPKDFEETVATALGWAPGNSATKIEFISNAVRSYLCSFYVEKTGHDKREAALRIVESELNQIKSTIRIQGE